LRNQVPTRLEQSPGIVEEWFVLSAVAENALLRQQLIVAARAAERPKFATYEL